MEKYKIGLDIGSTTIKTAVLDGEGKLVYSSYERHFADIKATLYNVLTACLDRFENFSIMVTGSGGINVSRWLDIPFIQEVVAGVRAIEAYLPDCDVAIELGGEDAKITYLSGGVEQRMNGTCAGGTGAFIDQMASLLNTDAAGLDKYAENSKIIYPIASRCGVFAKTDIQPLINEGADKADIAASIFQSVVNQTISGLACGKPIRGKVAFLGGPLHFLPQLGARFCETIKPEKSYFPENSQVFNAIGAALSSDNDVTAAQLKQKLELLSGLSTSEVERLAPLFRDENEIREFRARHSKSKIPFADIKKHKGAAYLGIDAGSTTTKVALINEQGGLLYNFYGANCGDPLLTVTGVLKEIYQLLPKDAYIGRSTVTGYGENFFKAALHIDDGEIETMAHQTASNIMLEGVEFILDIGGQDMKCLRLKDGVINDILLNEACSSGCGSFIETFAGALGMTAAEFSKVGVMSSAPVDLGSRCTVFMNSRVKQAQKEGASVADISAGLAYSVVKNALFKVIKLRDSAQIGDKVIVQGGTFMNECVLRAFELVSGKEVVRPDLAGLMGAYGAAILSRNNHDKKSKSTIFNTEQLDRLAIKKTAARCKRCNNHCLLTITDFGDGKKYITNNRCEKGGNAPSDGKAVKPANMYAYKYQRLFDYYKPLELKDAKRGRIGIPRVLNIYENYPFWFRFFTELGYRVELSPHSTRAIYDLGIETMPSESVCYPAKLTHGHVTALVNDGHTTIFYPCIPYEIKEDDGADNHYNCPVVSTYPEVLRNNMHEVFGDFEGAESAKVKFIAPFIPYNNPKRLIKRLTEEFKDIPSAEIERAVRLGYEEDKAFKDDIAREGERVLSNLGDTHAIVLAGRPYHLDPEINHGIPEMINAFGFAVLTEDSISHKHKIQRPIRVVDQWMYHSRLYSAASYVRTRDNIDLVQLNSFGCGLDAVTTDQVNEILSGTGKIYTCLKIDEVNNLGSAKIRIRSLMAVINERRQKNIRATAVPKPNERVLFTKEMRENYTIIAPQISPIHLDVLEGVLNGYGYKVEILPESPTALDTGLKFVNNDACYPSILTLGLIMDALLSGRYDTNKTAVMLTQTGGGCRATNYIPLLRKALNETKLSHVPVVSLNFAGLEKNPGFKITLGLMTAFIKGVIYGDLMMRLLYKVRPYEVTKGSADALYEKWAKICKDAMRNNDKNFAKNVKQMVAEFDALPVHDVVKPKIGLVGEILVKFHPVANNRVVSFIESEGGEAVMPDLLDFFLFQFYNDKIKFELLDGKVKKLIRGKLAIWLIEKIKKPMYEALRGTKFGAPSHIAKMAKMASEVVSLGNLSGEGWFLTAEMLELMHCGADNIVCMQPFACLPNHVTGKGVMKELKRRYPQANIVAVDYDPGASEVNQINRIKLMMSVAHKKVAEQLAADKNNG